MTCPRHTAHTACSNHCTYRQWVEHPNAPAMTSDDAIFNDDDSWLFHPSMTVPEALLGLRATQHPERLPATVVEFPLRDEYTVLVIQPTTAGHATYGLAAISDPRVLDKWNHSDPGLRGQVRIEALWALGNSALHANTLLCPSLLDLAGAFASGGDRLNRVNPQTLANVFYVRAVALSRYWRALETAQGTTPEQMNFMLALSGYSDVLARAAGWVGGMSIHST